MRSRESFEVQQLVKNMQRESSASSTDRGLTGAKCRRASAFLQTAKDQLWPTIRNDRLGLLTEADDKDFVRRGLRFGHISPRSSIPEEYKLELEPRGDHVFGVALYEQHGITIRGEKIWRGLELDFFASNVKDGSVQEKAVNAQKRRIDSLVNVKQALKCGVIAVEGSRTLYQTRHITSKHKGRDRQFSPDEISILVAPITSTGEVEEAPVEIGRCRVIGINQNQRYLLLEKHVSESEDEILMFDALKAFVRAKPSTKVFHDITVPAPETFEELNLAQKEVAHPLALTTATEVAGPPGTGKLKSNDDDLDTSLRAENLGLFGVCLG